MKAQYSDIEIINQIKKGNSDEVLLYLYKTAQPKLSNWIKKNNGNDEEAQDIFQDAVLAFYEFVLDDRFETGRSVDGFIYSIGRNMWINRAKKKSKLSFNFDNLENVSDDLEEENVIFESDTTKQADQMDALLNLIGERCKQLLTYSIFYNMSMIDIAEAMGFSNADTAKTKNYKCKKRLMKIINENESVKSFLYR